jgi:murein DD-endopeptidase MepM/ murein hydrolase activator NlpD
VIHYRTIALLLAAVMLFSPAITSAQAQGPIYVVEEGDTLFEIALVFGTSVDELAAENAIEDPSSIFPGQELVIPGLEGLTGRLRFENIGFGENLTSLSFKYGAPADLLARLNRLVHPDSLYAGQSVAYAEGSLVGSPMPNSNHGFVHPGESVLESAIGLNADPWAIRRLNRVRWAVPGAMLFALGDRTETSALPEGIHSVRVSPLPAEQGRTVVIQIESEQVAAVSGRLGDHELALLESAPGEFTALQGMHALAEAGLVSIVLEGASETSFVQSIRLIEGAYGFEALVVPEETLDPESTGPEDQLISDVVSMMTESKAWEGVFAFPTGYYEAFPSLFGTRRSYNGSAFVYYHTGLDLYGSTTTPVLAPAGGTVAFTGSLTVRGNVTYLDHGWGVYSGFLHQSEVLVEQGAQVVAGQTIGFVGGTGRVTGPHLHWEIWVGGVPVDPLEWVQTSFP